MRIELSKLKKLEGNPRIIKKEDMDKLKASIKKFGVIEGRPFLVSNRTGENIIIGGNQRYEACKALGIKEVPVHIMEGLTEEQEREIIIRDNVSNGDWDMDILANEWEVEQLKDWGVDINFETVEPTAEEDDFEVDEGIQTDIVLGDLFEIGPHRLLCGDSTNIDDVNKLMNGEKAELLLTDPPYGINYGKQLIKGDEFKEKTNKHGWRNFGNPNWDLDIPKDAFPLFPVYSDNQIVWGGNYFTDLLYPSQGWLLWDKGQRDFSLADGEMAWTSFDNAMRINTYARAKANREDKVHPTQKPIEIISWCIEYADRHGSAKTILDLFGGSGSTMVACHQLNRKCYMSELEPKYVQTIVNRMKKLAPDIEIKRNGKPYELQT